MKIIEEESNTTNKETFSDAIHLPEKFATINRLVARDVNSTTDKPKFFLYTKDDIVRFLKDPSANEKYIRNALIYLYGASSHFRRLIQYFASLTDLSYVVSPFKIDTATAKPATIRRNYRRVLNLLSAMDVRNQFEKIVTVCLREDVFYGTFRETTDSVIIQQLPSDYCTLSVIEDNALNVTFDFSYFDQHKDNLKLYPEEFAEKYKLYQNEKRGMRYQELDAPNSFAVKCSKDVLSYAVPPFAGLLREIYDLEDYKQLKLSKEELENYALLVMTLGIDDDGNWQMDLDKAKDFWRNLDGVLPEEIGSVLSPMKIDKISFERTHAGDVNTVAEAESALFSAAGVSSLLFNNTKASANALSLSIKVDQALTYSIVKSIECVVNRFIHRHGYGKYFKVTFLDVSPFNRKEAGDMYLKACQYSMPMVSYYCASQGLMQDEMDCMNFLEDDVLHIKTRFKPIQSSSTQSAGSADVDSDGEAGRPEEDADELTDSGEAWREEQ